MWGGSSCRILVGYDSAYLYCSARQGKEPVTPLRDNTARLAKELWSLEATTLSPAEFQTRFDNIYQSAEGPATLWHLGGAANNYLRQRPGSINIPEELAASLLASSMVDSRIIGLKLLNRCSTDIAMICAQISRALSSDHEGEVYGGLHELGNLSSRLSSCERHIANELSRCLIKLHESTDQYVRNRSVQLRECLQELAAAWPRD